MELNDMKVIALGEPQGKQEAASFHGTAFSTALFLNYLNVSLKHFKLTHNCPKVETLQWSINR